MATAFGLENARATAAFPSIVYPRHYVLID